MALWFFNKVVWYVLAAILEGIFLPSNMAAKTIFCSYLVKRLIVTLRCTVNVTTSSFQHFLWSLRGSLPKTGPLRFGSENQFPLNFAHEYILVQKYLKPPKFLKIFQNNIFREENHFSTRRQIFAVTKSKNSTRRFYGKIEDCELAWWFTSFTAFDFFLTH